MVQISDNLKIVFNKVIVILFLSIILSKSYALSELYFSECNFVDLNEKSCQWINFENNFYNWSLVQTKSSISHKYNIQSPNEYFLILYSNSNESNINSIYQSNLLTHSLSGICFKLRFIISMNCSFCRIKLFANFNRSENQFLGEYQMKNSNYRHEWNEIQTYSPINKSEKFRIYLMGNINHSSDQFIAINYISVKSGYCDDINESIIQLSAIDSNTTLNSSFSDPFKDRIGPRSESNKFFNDIF